MTFCNWSYTRGLKLVSPMITRVLSLLTWRFQTIYKAMELCLFSTIKYKRSLLSRITPTNTSPYIAGWCFFVLSIYFSIKHMKSTISQEIIKPWAIFCLCNSAGSRRCLARFATRGDGETYLFRVRRQLPQELKPELVFDT